MKCKGYDYLDLLTLNRNELELIVMSVWASSVKAMNAGQTEQTLWQLGHDMGFFTGFSTTCPFSDLRFIAKSKAKAILDYVGTDNEHRRV